MIALPSLPIYYFFVFFVFTISFIFIGGLRENCHSPPQGRATDKITRRIGELRCEISSFRRVSSGNYGVL